MAKRVITQTLLEGLRTGFKTDFQRGIGLAPSLYKVLTTVVDSGAAIETYGFLGDFPIFREWIGERRIRQLRELVYALRNRKFEVTWGIKRDDLEDDNNTLGLYKALFEGWGNEGESLKDRLVFEALDQGHLRPCYDNQNFFDSSHPVGLGTVSNIDTTGAVQPWYLLDCSKSLKPILYQDREAANFDMVVDPTDSRVFLTDEYLAGGKARGAAGYTMWQLGRRETRALTAANYEDAKARMAALRNDEGEPLVVKPTHLVVGTSNTVAARRLVKQANLAGGESNIYFGDIEVVEAPRLA